MRTVKRIVYALNGETRLLDPVSGQQRTLAAYRQWKDAAFNPFCVRPLWNQDRTRLLVFDAADMVRVLDADGSPLWELCTTNSLTECRAGALSPSGRLAAVYRASPGVVYHHGDARHDTTNEIEVWDIAAGHLMARIPAPVDGRTVHRIGFDPTERLIVTNPDPVQGPCALSIDTRTLTYVDVDSLLRRVYGPAKQGAAFGARQGRRVQREAAWSVSAGRRAEY
jgi:hypothetical protein